MSSVPQLSLHTPVGDITVFEEDGRIVSLDWGWVPNQATSPVLDGAREQLQAYFDGELTEFDLPLAPPGTAYRRAVWKALCSIPYGETRSYQDIALKAGGRNVTTRDEAKAQFTDNWRKWLSWATLHE